MKMDAKGYTLVELALIVSILSAMMFMAAPGIRNGMNRYRLNSFARLIAEDLRYAQQQASMNWRSCSLSTNEASQRISVRMGSRIIKSDPYPSFVKIDYTSFASNEVVFNERGNPSKGGSLCISCNGLQYHITVLPVTGRIKIYEQPH